MKYLMFSLVVAGALIYLFTADKADIALNDDGRDQVFKEMIEKADVATANAKAALSSKEIVPEVPSVTTSPSIKTPAPQVAALMQEQSEPPQAMKEQKLAPEVAKRREEILDPAPQNAGQGFEIVANTDRQEQLRELSEDMELFSAQISSQ